MDVLFASFVRFVMSWVDMSCGRAICTICAICSAIRSLQKCFMCKKSIILHFNKLVWPGRLVSFVPSIHEWGRSLAINLPWDEIKWDNTITNFKITIYQFLLKAELFKIWDPSSEENGRYEVAIFIKADLFTVTNFKITIYLWQSV